MTRPVRFGDWGFAHPKSDGMVVRCSACGESRKRALHVGKAMSFDRDEAHRIWRQHEVTAEHQRRVSKQIGKEEDFIRTTLPVMDAIEKWAQ